MCGGDIICVYGAEGNEGTGCAGIWLRNATDLRIGLFLPQLKSHRNSILYILKEWILLCSRIADQWSYRIHWSFEEKVSSGNSVMRLLWYCHIMILRWWVSHLWIAPPRSIAPRLPKRSAGSPKGPPEEWIKIWYSAVPLFTVYVPRGTVYVALGALCTPPGIVYTFRTWHFTVRWSIMSEWISLTHWQRYTGWILTTTD